MKTRSITLAAAILAAGAAVMGPAVVTTQMADAQSETTRDPNYVSPIEFIMQQRGQQLAEEKSETTRDPNYVSPLEFMMLDRGTAVI
jgi:hypothetical protein